MRIAQVCPFFYPVRGGMEEHVLNISRLLIKFGHEVDVFTSNSSRTGVIKEKYERIDGINVYRFKVIFSVGDFGKFWPSFLLRLVNGDYDLIHVHNYRHVHTILSLLISKIIRKPCVITTHSPFHPITSRRTLSRILIRFYDTFLSRIIDNCFSKIILVTESERKYFRHVNGKKLVVIPNGIASNAFKRVNKRTINSVKKKFSISKKDIPLLFIGRIHPTKGLFFLLKAFYKLWIKNSNFKLIIVGPIQDREYFSKLLHFVDSKDLKHSVIFTGFVSEEEKISLIELSKVFVLPSIYEPFGIVILEAFARGKPVVAVDSDGPRYLIKNYKSGFLVKYGDEKSFSHCIELLLKDRKLYREISANNRRKAREFTWDKITKKLIEVYEEVTRSR